MKEFKTRDLALSAYLITLGFDCTRVEKEEIGTRYYFVFPYFDSINSAVTRFTMGNATVEPRAYHGGLRSAKILLNQQLKNGHTSGGNK